MFSNVWFNRAVIAAVSLCFVSGSVAGVSMVTGWKPTSLTVTMETPKPTIYDSESLEQFAKSYDSTPGVVVTPRKRVSAKQLACMQENIYFESRDQSLLGNAMVGIVTMERAKKSKNPDDICAVVFKPKQFSWANKGRLKPKLTNDQEKRAWAVSGILARVLLESEFRDVDTLLKNVTHYHTTAVNPKWNRNMHEFATIGDHIFYREG